MLPVGVEINARPTAYVSLHNGHFWRNVNKRRQLTRIMSKKFSRNFACQNDFRYVKKSTIDKNSCRKNSVEILPVETILIYLQEYLSKIFWIPFYVRNFFVEIIQPKSSEMWDFLQCRNYSWNKNKIIEYFRLSKKFSVLNLINKKVFECRKYSAF